MHRGPRCSLNPQNPEGEFLKLGPPPFYLAFILIAPRKGPVACIKWGRISHDSKQPLFISLSTFFSFCNSIGAK
ncbi:hypothetical protein DTO021D3_7032 [Paecilomyces variotii]|nr:hypothetical protein DTO032I3_3902 [Paecilomyces variotii]KAJ9276127.1 hypothetical protein DTO021D3_7032 [Paecilomyces variotii]KAJ9340196.1 hypothetical protein DTO027B6_7267 [Paecilomyces variotii]KAJ9377545.1 hypothetical protein DTO032I4_8084 [Paecilomyces variotii]KAJ9405728.1 hypothetical protein DTO045G8_6561 [Paecilomyces variotii]